MTASISECPPSTRASREIIQWPDDLSVDPGEGCCTGAYCCASETDRECCAGEGAWACGRAALDYFAEEAFRVGDQETSVVIHPRYGSVHEAREVVVRYRWLGVSDGPVVVVQGGTSSGRRVAALPGESGRGWWPACVGDSKVVDTRRFRVLALDWITPAELPGVPAISTEDQAQAIVGVLARHGITRAYAHVGASYGGMVGQALAVREPQLVGRLVVISAAHRSHPMTTALRVVQRRIVEAAGDDPAAQRRALAIARGLAVTTYRSEREFGQRFTAPAMVAETGVRLHVEDYLDAVGERFAAAITPERFCALSESVDLHEIDPRAITVPTTLIGVGSDRLVPIDDMRRLAHAISAPCSLYELEGLYGHDTFLKESERVGRIVATALAAVA